MASIIFVALVALEMLSEAYSLPTHGTEMADPNEWPQDCQGLNYCWIQNKAYKGLQGTIDGLLKGQIVDYRMGDELDERISGTELNDMGHCQPKFRFKEIYMIKDKHGDVWFVPQNANFTIKIKIEECGNLGRVTEEKQTGFLNNHTLLTKQVHCVERKVDFKFPVLSKNHKEVYLLSPYQGLPLSCSTKILK